MVAYCAQIWKPSDSKDDEALLGATSEQKQETDSQLQSSLRPSGAPSCVDILAAMIELVDQHRALQHEVTHVRNGAQPPSIAMSATLTQSATRGEAAADEELERLQHDVSALALDKQQLQQLLADARAQLQGERESWAVERQALEARISQLNHEVKEKKQSQTRTEQRLQEELSQLQSANAKLKQQLQQLNDSQHERASEPAPQPTRSNWSEPAESQVTDASAPGPIGESRSISFVLMQNLMLSH